MGNISQVEKNYKSRLQQADVAYNASMDQYDALIASATKDNRREIYEKADAIYDIAVIELKKAKTNAIILYRIEMQNL